MSYYLDHLTTLPADEARAKFEALLSSPLYHKGYDVGRTVLDATFRGTVNDLRQPIFSTRDDQGELRGFLDAIGVAELSELRAKLGCNVALQDVTDVTQLRPEEAFMEYRLPAVRVELFRPPSRLDDLL